MKHIGNYKDIVQDEWLDFLKTHDGQLLPDRRECLLPDFDDQNKGIIGNWRPEYPPFWYKFEIQDLPFTIPWPVDLGLDIDWWVIKQYPGQMIPIHIDQNPAECTHRYILMLQDYEPGHVLIWDGKLVSDYKRGDLFKVNDVNSMHGGCNISNNIRLLAYLTVWN
jgi:hypothetical protein